MKDKITEKFLTILYIWLKRYRGEGLAADDLETSRKTGYADNFFFSEIMMSNLVFSKEGTNTSYLYIS
jgi:hypothetical protein